MKAYCEDCGTKIHKGFCPNCDEEHFIADQYRDLGMTVPETIFDAEREQIRNRTRD